MKWIYLQFTETNLQTRPMSAMKNVSVRFNNGICSFRKTTTGKDIFDQMYMYCGNIVFLAICLVIDIWYYML